MSGYRVSWRDPMLGNLSQDFTRWEESEALAMAGDLVREGGAQAAHVWRLLGHGLERITTIENEEAE